MVTWTVDVESDWGGRIDEYQGIKEGLPQIYEIFAQYKIKAIFFVSTELLTTFPNLIKEIEEKGHRVGSHGHFHIRYHGKWRSEADRLLSMGYFSSTVPYRAPWFHYETEDIYSKKKNHVSVLKYSWRKCYVPDNPIFYIHPFDIVRGNRAPGIFTHILYFRPEHVRDTFKYLCRIYPS